MEQSSCDLPNQIIMNEILIRLPVKSLCRFKAVSKLWYAVFTSPRFAKDHFDYNRQLNSNSRLVFFQYRQKSWLLDYEAYDHEDPVQKRFDYEAGDYTDPGGLRSLGRVFDADLKGIEAHPIGSSCGLVCLLPEDGQIRICNPILRQCRIISTPNPFGKQELMILCGFGYVSSIDDFKLILGLKDQLEDKKTMLYVYSLRSNKWRTIEGGYYFRILARCRLHRKGILVNECLHWSVIATGRIYDGRIFAFDLLHEVFKEIPIPQTLSARVPYMLGSSESSGLSAMDGCLCLSICWKEQKVEIWKLKQYDEMNSWVKLHNLRFLSCYNYDSVEFFGFTKTGKFLICCNYRFKSFNQDHIFIVGPHQPYAKFNIIESFSNNVNTIVDYVESLVSPFDLAAPTCKRGIIDKYLNSTP